MMKYPHKTGAAAQQSDVRVGCCASLGNSYGFGGFRNFYDAIREHPEGWTDDELLAMVRRIKNCGFVEVIPWTDYPAGELHESGAVTEVIPVDHAREAFLERVRRFVKIAHAEGLRVLLYFQVGTMAVTKTHEDGEKRLHVNTLGVTYPQYASRDGLGRSSLDLAQTANVDLAFASLGYPEVLHWIAEYVVNTVLATGADGVQLEPVGTLVDNTGTRVYGYDEPIIRDFKQRNNRDPVDLPNDDHVWVSHRCEYTTRLVREVRQRITGLDRNIELSIQCHDLVTDRARCFWPWREWVEEKLVNACYLKSSTAQGFHEALVEGRQWCQAHGVRFCGILDMKRYSEFLTPQAIADGVRVMLDSGVVQATIYGLAFTALARNPMEVPLERWLEARELLRGEL